MSEIKGPVWAQDLHTTWTVTNAEGHVYGIGFNEAVAGEVADALNAREELALLRAYYRAERAMEDNAGEWRGETTYALEDVRAVAAAVDALRDYYAAHPESDVRP